MAAIPGANIKHIREVYQALEQGIFRDAVFGRNVTVIGDLTVDGNFIFGDAAVDTLTINGKVLALSSLTSQTTENKQFGLTYATDSTFITGTNITYTSARGSAAISISGTWTGATGGYSNIYSLVTASTNWPTANDGVIGIKSVALSSGVAITAGNLYGGQFIAKKAGAGVATAQTAVIGVEGWFMETGSGEVRTGIGGNFGWHADSSAGSHTGAVWRGIQVFCDSAGTSNANETTGIYLWGQTGTTINGLVVGAGTWTNGIRFIAGGTCTTGISFEGTVTTAIQIGSCTTGISISGTGATVASKAFTTAGWTVNNANFTDGIGAVEADLTLTGTSAGNNAALSAWVNMNTGTHNAGYVAAQTNGIYEAGAAVITGAKIIFGMRMDCICADTDAYYYPFSIVNNANTTTALFDVNDEASDLGLITDVGSDSGKLVPLYKIGATLKYVKIYNHS